ncbi:hypothetical protein LINPERHAP2_LOCUS14240 [Linum perenne]
MSQSSKSSHAPPSPPPLRPPPDFGPLEGRRLRISMVTAPLTLLW